MQTFAGSQARLVGKEILDKDMDSDLRARDLGLSSRLTLYV